MRGNACMRSMYPPAFQVVKTTLTAGDGGYANSG